MTMAKRTVLLVDDSLEDRLIFRRFLTRDPAIHYTVLEADRGDAALALCRTTTPDCILLDYQLPDMNGLELLQALVMAAHPHLYPIVMLTGAGNTTLAVQAMQRGAHDYLAKDRATPEQLQRAINNALEKVALLRELEQQREWSRLILTSIGDGVIAADQAGCVTFMNPVAEALTGWAASAAHGRPLLEIFRVVDEESRQPLDRVLTQLWQSGIGQGVAAPALLLAYTGGTPVIAYNIEYNGAPIRHADGRLLGVVLVFRDITERRRHEGAIQQWNATLERQVAQRTAELTRRIREMDNLSHVAAHDLKAPLRAIQHLATWIATDAAAVLPRASQAHLDKLQGRVQRMDKLLDDLQLYLRADRDERQVELVDLNRLVEEIGGLVLPEQGFTLQTPTPLPTLRTVRVPLETVLRNLINNAVKHHDRSQGRIQITGRDLGAMLELAVRDDGPGIPPEFHRRIFDLFQTLKPRDQVEGSGMGLAIVKKIVESHSGQITVESTPGEGATFRFTWPKALAM